jgi:galactokinase
MFHAPGRVNLIGEHTDYNQGFVLPIAVDRGTTAAIAPRNDRILRVWSINLNETVELDLDHSSPPLQGRWENYVEGTAAALAARGIQLSGADIALQSDVSIGGGLSSSAALEMSIATGLVAISRSSLDRRSLALAGQTAEHEYAGIRCGIMDQLSSLFGRKGNAILIDCRSVEMKPIPLQLGEYTFVVCDSRTRHELAALEYNRRRQDCESGVQLLKKSLPLIESLRDVTQADFEKHSKALPADLLRRCRHVVTENARTLLAAEAIAAGEVSAMGRLMNASHISLRDDYEVSCSELDLLVKSATSQPGVLGVRMTGGGFGGCTVNLVHGKSVESFREEVSKEYRRQTGLIPEIFVAVASEGAGEVLLQAY